MDHKTIIMLLLTKDTKYVYSKHKRYITEDVLYAMIEGGYKQAVNMLKTNNHNDYLYYLTLAINKNNQYVIEHIYNVLCSSNIIGLFNTLVVGQRQDYLQRLILKYGTNKFAKHVSAGKVFNGLLLARYYPQYNETVIKWYLSYPPKEYGIAYYYIGRHPVQECYSIHNIMHNINKIINLYYIRAKIIDIDKISKEMPYVSDINYQLIVTGLLKNCSPNMLHNLGIKQQQPMNINIKKYYDIKIITC